MGQPSELGPYVKRTVNYVTDEPSVNQPSVWDDEPRGIHVVVGVERFFNPDGSLFDIVISSDENHILVCRQNPGPEPLCE